MATRRASPAATQRWRHWRPWSKPRARWGWVAIGTAATGLLAYALVGVAEWILGVAARAIWFVDSLHQGLVWTVFLAVLGYLTVRLGARARTGRVPPPSSVQPEPSELTRLANVIRRARTSPVARRELARRLTQTAVVVRAQREGIPLRQAWDDIESGKWPPNPALAAVLRPRDIRALPARRGDPLREIDRAVSALWNYARGGNLDDR